MIKKKFKHLLYRYILPYGGLMLIKLISLTYRFKILDLEKEQEILNNKKRLVYASWHQRFFPGITFFSTRKPIAIIISKSNDGEMIARAVDILGWYPVRGSSSRGGKQALEKIKNLALSEYKIGHIVDGPQGPFGVVKPGLIKIAQAADLPIVPTITSAQKKWIFNSWDRFMVPKPFSRIIIRFGDAIHIPSEMNKDKFEKKRLLVETQMKVLYEDTDRIWFSPKKVKEIFE
ncbi:MAG: lysophospholipid acyltransferase family protein [Desulfobacula sp.]|nr:lysophospholipid acyltransferase family protein [Desulfobacula sp.]